MKKFIISYLSRDKGFHQKWQELLPKNEVIESIDQESAIFYFFKIIKENSSISGKETFAITSVYEFR